jgi:SHS2 domain-containing protein
MNKSTKQPKDPELTLDYYELIDHTADMGIRVWGENQKSLFVNAGQAMFDLITAKQMVEANNIEQVEVTGRDTIDLLINWLRELLFLWTGKERLVHSIHVESISGTAVNGRVMVDSFDSTRHVIRHEIKAVTYHQAEVKPVSNGWIAEVIFDV